MADWCGKITNSEDGCMVGFLLSVMFNICSLEPTQMIQVCCWLGEDCVAAGMDNFDREAIDICSFADEYYIAKNELDDKRQEVEHLEEEVKELKKTVARL